MFVAREQGRPPAEPPAEAQISVVTVGELRIGVLVASEPSVRAQRMRTLTEVDALAALPVDDEVLLGIATPASQHKNRFAILAGSPIRVSAAPSLPRS